ncbi:MAG TPA: MMPL family transporter, partial [Candidatus Sumerlaeota bacterium]|nr:MMPL family transporter [Candidatus Sumerlaeota bacterium]
MRFLRDRRRLPSSVKAALLTLVVLSLSGARGLIALLGYNNLFGMTTFATNLLVTLAIAAATD